MMSYLNNLLIILYMMLFIFFYLPIFGKRITDKITPVEHLVAVGRICSGLISSALIILIITIIIGIIIGE